MGFRKKKIQTQLIQEKGEGYAIAVKGKAVKSFIKGDFEDTLILEDAYALRVVIESGRLEPSVDPQQLVGKCLTYMFADKHGDLSFGFEDGIEYCIKHCEYEAWHIRNDLTLHIVSVAGGGVAIWL